MHNQNEIRELTENETRLFSAIRNGEDIRPILESGDIDINCCDEDEVTFIHAAALYSDNGDEIKALCKIGADVDVADYFGWTPIRFAVKNGKHKVIQVLYQLGANVDIPDNFGRSPVFFAAETGKDEVVKILCECGANFNIPDKDNRTPLYIAAKNGRHKVVTQLVSDGADTKDLEEDFGLKKDVVGNFRLQDAVAEGRLIYDQKKRNEESIKQEVTNLLAAFISENKVGDDVSRLIGSYSAVDDIAALSKVLKPSSLDYQRTTELLREYKEAVSAKIESGELIVTGGFKHKFIDGMNARLDPLNYVRTPESQRLNEGNVVNPGCCTIS